MSTVMGAVPRTGAAHTVEQSPDEVVASEVPAVADRTVSNPCAGLLRRHRLLGRLPARWKPRDTKPVRASGCGA